MASFDFDDDFEAQLAAMNDEVDSQYADYLSQSSSQANDVGKPPAVSDNIAALAATIPANTSLQTKSFDTAIADYEPESLDNLQLSLTDIDSDAESDFGENEPLTTYNHNTAPSQHRQRGDGKPGESGHNHNHDDNHDHGHSHGHDNCGEGGCDAKSELQRQLEEKYLAEELAMQQQWDEEMKLYQQDQTLSGFIFNDDIAGFQKAIADGSHHVHEYDFKGEHTALHHAVFHEELEFIKVLMENGCNINVTNFRGETPLMLACKLENNLALVALLIERYGADIHAKDKVGLHAFHHSAEKGRVYHLSLLHTVYGVDVNVVDAYNKNALHWASWAGHITAVEWLLRHGCSPYTKDSVGCYPIHWASSKSRDRVIQLLAEWDRTDGQCLGGIRTVADKTYWKQVRKDRFGEKFDYIHSQWVQNPDSIQIDSAIPDQIKFHKKADRDTRKRYSNEDFYDELVGASYNAIDTIVALPPSKMPAYVPFPAQLKIKNNDGYDVKAFALFKNESLTGVDRYHINNTIKLLESYDSGQFWYTNSFARSFYQQLQRSAYLPLHFFGCYFGAIMTSIFIMHPLFALHQPSLLWTCWLFDLMWCAVIYNWYRIVFATPARLDFFTPATQSSTLGFGDDGSTTFVSDLPTLTPSPIDQSSFSSSARQPNRTSALPSPGSFQSKVGYSADCCLPHAFSPPNHQIPTQRFTISEYQSISTLYTLFVDLMTSGQATESNTCYTCEIARPLRSKHCPRCNRCVPRFDHHCPFFNQDIAYTNYHNFLWFLILVPLHFVLLAFQFFTLSSMDLFTIKHFPVLVFYIFSPIFTKETTLLLFKVFFYHLALYVVFDLMLFSQHLFLLSEGLTTNEAMNRQRYSYLAISGVEWNPFSRGGFWTNFISHLGFHKWHREPLCMTDEQCKSIDYCASPLSSSWAEQLKNKQTKKDKKSNRV